MPTGVTPAADARGSSGTLSRLQGPNRIFLAASPSPAPTTALASCHLLRNKQRIPFHDHRHGQLPHEERFFASYDAARALRRTRRAACTVRSAVTATFATSDVCGKAFALPCDLL